MAYMILSFKGRLEKIWRLGRLKRLKRLGIKLLSRLRGASRLRSKLRIRFGTRLGIGLLQILQILSTDRDLRTGC